MNLKNLINLEIDLSNLLKDILNHYMMWSGDENTYCTVIGSINFNDVKEEEFEKLINDKLKF